MISNAYVIFIHRYASWRNTDERKSVAHPDRAPEQGGLLHLSVSEQRRIADSREVPPHLCCTDQEWLYRIYQDTYVDVDAVVRLVESKSGAADNSDKSQNVAHSITHPHEISHASLSPSRIRNATCSESNDATGNGHDAVGITISWQAPVNLGFIEYGRVQYEVWIQESGGPVDVDYVAWMLDKTSHRFTTGLKSDTTYNVWVRCVLDKDVVGPFNSEQLTCKT